MANKNLPPFGLGFEERELLFEFVVPGPPNGYYAKGKYPNWKRLNEYHAWCDVVRTAAVVAGVALPLVATEAVPLHIHTIAYFDTRVHHDPENIHKGAKDALFYPMGGVKRKGSADKHTGGTYAPPLYDKDPRVEVWIWSQRRRVG